ncbi:dicarboxylate/amino acid:cation symporter [Weeksellaceae bacterium KMM 9713]|uniref:Dicarboxylate/amino acid:cation symporter n=1 Tax=Profundicola chukchiensis TaxID=2961959 RepID=A0A9X4MXZ7_9FLAO|nr:dicarboxylate/amino acid:cation symporter [Profundicola chukchiensis]MDG4946173.1 dicarboxylate/amino acid:cation symporter [Profundicola chukchiensis]
MKKLGLHWQILIGMVLGILFGFFAAEMNWNQFVIDWIKPFGTVFINLLKMIAVPLIIVSLITGIAELKDISKISKMGGKTIGFYLMTTVVAVTIGLTLANIIQPGTFIDEASRDQLMAQYASDAGGKILEAESQKEQGPLQPLVDIVPDNFFKSLTDNGKMLQVIFFTILVGIGLILIPEEKARPVTQFFSGLNEVILKIIDIIMLIAPIGVFALLAAILVEIPSFSVLQALLVYALTVLAGLAVLIFVIYSLMVSLITKHSYFDFLKAIAPAQLVAFSTSSSAATLPVTMERVTEHLGVDEEVASFVLPLGATINMDGTSLYQAVAAIFIAQAFGMQLDLATQIMIVLTATLASIGSAAVPSAGMVMLVIVLGQAGIPEAGLALIFAIDRPLDMCRTVVNVTSDAMVSTLIAKSEGQLLVPDVKEWDDNYPKN